QLQAERLREPVPHGAASASARAVEVKGEFPDGREPGGRGRTLLRAEDEVLPAREVRALAGQVEVPATWRGKLGPVHGGAPQLGDRDTLRLLRYLEVTSSRACGGEHLGFDGGGEQGDDERTCNYTDAHQHLLRGHGHTQRLRCR